MKQPVYAPGTIVASRYRIDKAIARGGCSIVYRGTHIDMQRSVALKIMASSNGPVDKAWAQRFQREAQLASQLRHPNTIIIYDYGRDQGLWFIAMEWVDGASLRNVIKDTGALDPDRVVRLSIQCLKSLAEAHKHHILHRDLKPSNIMVTRDAEGAEMIKMLDFGLAKADPLEWQQNNPEAMKLTRDGDFVGTPRYASPEQLRGHQVTRASDIYGMGMVMWEMLMGAPAVPGVDFGVCVEHHLGQNPWRLPPGRFSPGLASVVEKALEKDPNRRFQSCEKMLEALARLVEDAAKPKGPVSLFGEEDDDGFFSTDFTPAPVRPTQQTTRARKTESPPVQSPSGFAQLSANQLEIDRGAQRRPHRSAHPTSHGARVEEAEPEQADATRLLVGLGGAIVLICIIGGVFISLTGDDSGDPDELPVNERSKLLEEIGRGASNAPSAKIDPREEMQETLKTKTTIQILDSMQQSGWSYDKTPQTSELDEVKQTTLRLRRDAETVDITLYECDRLKLARELEFQVTPPVEAVRIGLTVVWLRPIGEFGAQGVHGLRKVLISLKQ